MPGIYDDEDDELLDPERRLPAMGEPAQPTQPAPGAGPRIAKPSSGDSGIPPVTLRGISPQLQQRTAQDEAQAQNLTKGSGISQIHNGVGRGILRGLDAIGSAILPGPLSRIPGTELHHDSLVNQNSKRLGEDIGEQGKVADTAQTIGQTSAIPSTIAHTEAETNALNNPQPKPKEEKWTVIPGATTPKGELIEHEENSGQVRVVPNISGVQPLKEPNTPDKDKDISDYLAAHNLPDSPANREKARGDIAKRGQQEPGNFMPLYDDKGHVAGAWDPKSGRIVKSPEGALPGNTAQGHTMAEKAGQTADQANAAMGSFTRYQESFKNLAPQLTEDDRRALQVLTSHEQVAQGFLAKSASGVLDTLFGVPLSGYSEKAMGGIMTKDQFDKMSPAGKKMLADYFNAVIQNFGNMKQILGSVGRNPMQLQAEINTIPLPYLDAQTAATMFADKFDDMKSRNRNIPGFGQQSAPPPQGDVIVVKPEEMR